MAFRKTLSLITALLLLTSLSACKNNETVIEKTTENQTASIEQTQDNALQTQSADIEITHENHTIIAGTNTVSTTAEVTETVSAVNPSEWTKTEIIDAYKKAAEKSDKTAKSEKAITMKDFSINNGQYENVIDFVMPIMSKLLANNSTAEDGITGGYKNLSEADVKSAKAYPVGNNTAIELVLNNQTDGPYADALGGPVGHAITAVGDISVVTDQINDLGIAIQISEKDTKINYTNATVKVLIDKDGNIIKGTWKYTVDIQLNNYKVGKSTVEQTSVVMDNVITVNGGF